MLLTSSVSIAGCCFRIYDGSRCTRPLVTEIRTTSKLMAGALGKRLSYRGSRGFSDDTSKLFQLERRTPGQYYLRRDWLVARVPPDLNCFNKHSGNVALGVSTAQIGTCAVAECA